MSLARDPAKNKCAVQTLFDDGVTCVWVLSKSEFLTMNSTFCFTLLQICLERESVRFRLASDSFCEAESCAILVSNISSWPVQSAVCFAHCLSCDTSSVCTCEPVHTNYFDSDIVESSNSCN